MGCSSLAILRRASRCGLYVTTKGTLSLVSFCLYSRRSLLGILVALWICWSTILWLYPRFKKSDLKAVIRQPLSAVSEHIRLYRMA
ncbi:hypothetical protein FKM82_026940 [Ascaphus truei]